MSMIKKTRSPSKQLLSLFLQSASVLVSFADLWKKVLAKGKEEGFSAEELQDMFRPYLKNRLTSAKIKYLFDPDYYKAKSKEQYSDNPNLVIELLNFN